MYSKLRSTWNLEIDPGYFMFVVEIFELWELRAFEYRKLLHNCIFLFYLVLAMQSSYQVIVWTIAARGALRHSTSTILPSWHDPGQDRKYIEVDFEYTHTYQPSYRLGVSPLQILVSGVSGVSHRLLQNPRHWLRQRVVSPPFGGSTGLPDSRSTAWHRPS